MSKSRIIALILLVGFGLPVAVPLAGADCNGNGEDDVRDVQFATSADCNGNFIPDDCELGSVQFGPPRPFQTGRLPGALVAADFDGDGLVDLATLNDETSGVSVSVLWGEGSGRFDPAHQELGVDARLIDLAAGDMNADGLPDLAVVLAGSVRVVFSGVERSLSVASPTSIASTISGASVGDVNADGRGDLVLADRAGDSASVLLGLGDGSFDVGAVVPVGDSPRAPIIADFDGDGHPDIATVNRRSGDVSLRLGDSTGAFRRGGDFEFRGGSTPDRLVAADLTGDGRVDLVAASASAVSVFENVGGAFAEAVPFLLPSPSFSQIASTALGVLDVDLDGDLDVVAPGQGPARTVFLVNRGDGVFDASVSLTRLVPIEFMATGDFNGDAVADVAIALKDPLGVGVFFSGESNPLTFSRNTQGGGKPHGLTLGDVNGDGWLDAATGNGGQGTISIFLGDGTGRLLPPSREIDMDTDVNHITGADLDDDGDFDLASVDLNSGQVNALYNDGSGNFERVAMLAGARPFFITTARLNEDVYPDLVSVHESENDIAVFLSLEAGLYGVPVRVPVGIRPLSVVAGDLDRDGHQDLAVSSELSSEVTLLFGDGTGALLQRQRVEVRRPHHVDAGDFDNDGDLDLVTASRQESEIGLLKNRGDGSFEAPVLFPSGTLPYSVIPVDVNGDALLDVATASVSSSSVAIQLNLGGGEFSLAQEFPVGNGPRFVRSADLDADGDADLVSGDREQGSITVLLNEQGLPRVAFREKICTEAEFFELSVASTQGGAVERLTKYILPASPGGPGTLGPHFQNVQSFPLHLEFLASTFPELFGNLTSEEYEQLVNFRATRVYFVGTLYRLRIDGAIVYGFDVLSDPGEPPSQEEVTGVFETLNSVVNLEPLGYFPTTRATREAAATWSNLPFPIFSGDSSLAYQAYTQAVGYGRVRLLDPSAFEAANARGQLGFQDVLVLTFAPRDIEGVVAAVVTAEPQGELSHVLVRMARRNTPNAFDERALERFAPFEGQLVRIEVTDTRVDIQPATLAEAEAFWAANRPSLSFTPEVDADFDELTSLTEIADLIEGGDTRLVPRYGGKATGLGRLQGILREPRWAEYEEKGFAVPMRYYLEFMRANTMPSALDPSRRVSYEAYLEEVFADPRFLSDSEVRFQTLANLREHMQDDGVVDLALVERIAARIREVLGTPPNTRVRFRSSSNIEDGLEFNGAGLYDSTSGCIEDDFDPDNNGPSRCDPSKDNERGITRALKRVWASLWNFRAHEERAFFGIEPDLAAMAVLVNRTFIDESANGVAFTGNPADPSDQRYMIAVQLGEESVVSPEPGVTAALIFLTIGDGEVTRIERVRESSLVEPGTTVLSDDQLRELGRLMAHIDRDLPIDLGEFSREQVLLDLEFKFMPDGELAVKQVRPFLLSTERPPAPSFELEIPPGTEVCGTFVGRDDLGVAVRPEEWYALKTTLRLVPGRIPLPTSRRTFEAALVEELRVGPERKILTAEKPGQFQVTRRPRGESALTDYAFDFEQRFLCGDGETYELRLFDLKFVGRGEEPVSAPRVFDEAFLTHELELVGFQDESVGYSSCTHELLPVFRITVELGDGTSIELLERFEEPPSVNLTGPASLVFAELRVAKTRRVVTSYWDLIYSARRHNLAVRYWVLLEPPLAMAGLVSPVRVIEIVRPETDPLPIDAAVNYLDEKFETIASPEVLSFDRRQATGADAVFRRGDVDADGRTRINDALFLLEYLFRRGDALPCGKAADSNDDGRLSLVDAAGVLFHIFRGRVIPQPVDVCGFDPSVDGLSCEGYAACR